MDVQGTATKLVGAWKIQSATPMLTTLANNTSYGGKIRLPAIEALREVGGKDAVASLRTLAKDQDDSSLRDNQQDC